MHNQGIKKGVLSNKTTISIIIGVIILIIIIIIIIKIASGGDVKKVIGTDNSPKSKGAGNNCPKTTTEALVLSEQFYVSPGGEPWTTEKIDYRFKFRAEGHSFSLQFTGENGWLNPITYPPEGDFIMPLEARPGPVKVSAGVTETKTFRIQLYKKIQIKM